MARSVSASFPRPERGAGAGVRPGLVCRVRAEGGRSAQRLTDGPRLAAGRLLVEQVVEHEQRLKDALVALLPALVRRLARVALRRAVLEVLDAEALGVPLLGALERQLDGTCEDRQRAQRESESAAGGTVNGERASPDAPVGNCSERYSSHASLSC